MAWQGSWSNRKKGSIKKKKDKLSTYSILSQFLFSKHLFFVCFLSTYHVSVWRIWIRKFRLNFKFRLNCCSIQCFKNKFPFFKKDNYFTCFGNSHFLLTYQLWGNCHAYISQFLWWLNITHFLITSFRKVWWKFKC